MRQHSLFGLALTVLLGACQAQVPSAILPGEDGAAATRIGPFEVTPIARFNEPWALAFLPDGRVLVTEKSGTLRLFDPARRSIGVISGIPEVAYGGQGGLGDVALHPQFSDNHLVYFSYAEPGADASAGAAVARAQLRLDANGGGRLEALEVIWRQVPKVTGRGHYGHRIVFDAEGHVWISSGERQKFDPAQDMRSNLGTLVRLNDDGSVPPDNPFTGQGEIAAQFWSLGHRNPLGLAFDSAGRLWEVEMGPKGGDELNLIRRGGNYGWPLVSNGDHYDGRPIPDHTTGPEFIAPALSWTPVISPSSLMFYSGAAFPEFDGHAFISGLSSKSLIRVITHADGSAREAARYAMGTRIRSVYQGPDGLLWLLEDGRNARLLRLSPAGG